MMQVTFIFESLLSWCRASKELMNDAPFSHLVSHVVCAPKSHYFWILKYSHVNNMRQKHLL